MNEVYLVLSAGLGALITKSVDWFFVRREKQEDVKGKEIDNEVKLADYYKIMLDDLSKRYETKYTDIVTLYESKEKILKDEITLLNRKISDLKKENIALRKRIKELEK